MGNMRYLIVRFQNSVLQKVPMDGGSITIGRGRDNSIAIDNLAVSNHHAQIRSEQDLLVIEDLDSLNGTFVNGLRVKRSALKDGDVIWVGKHSISMDGGGSSKTLIRSPSPPAAAAKNTSNFQETFVLDTGKRRDMMRQMAAAGERSQITPSRIRVATLVVISGRVDQSEYPLTGKLTVIGASPMATVRLRGWFKPKLAAQINRRDDGYYLGLGHKVPKLNGIWISSPALLSDGDLIEVCGTQLRFAVRE
jgi:hypothetical protein